MDDDLLDAVAWAIDKKIADPRKIAIMGGSYGGYATLSASPAIPKLTPAASISSDLRTSKTLIRTIPPYWEAIRSQISKGDRRSRHGRGVELSLKRSAISSRPDRQASAHRPRGA